MNQRTKSIPLWKRSLKTLSLSLVVAAFVVFLLNQSQKGRVVTTAIVREFLALYEVQLMDGEVSLSPLGVNLRGAKLCFETTCGFSENIEITLFPLRGRVTGLCPEFSGENAPLTVEKLESITKKLFQFTLPVQALSISSPKDCNFTGGREIQIELADALTVSIDNQELFRAVREKEYLRFQGKLGPIGVKGELSSTLQLTVSAETHGERVHYQGSLSKDTEQFIGSLTGVITGSFAAQFGSNQSIELSRLKGGRDGYLVGVDRVLIDKGPEGITAKIAGVSLQSPMGALSDGSVVFHCKGGGTPCRFTDGTIRLLEVGDGLQVDQVDFAGEIQSSSPCIVFSKLRGLLWGGSVETLKLDLCDQSSVTRVTFSEIELTKPVTLLSGKRLQIEGEGSGELLFQRNPFRITTGSLTSTPGLIQYLDETEMLPPLARDALRDLRFTKLTGDFTLSEGNILGGSVSIQGKSPLLNTPRPVNVNLGWESDINKLLHLWKVGRELREGASHSELGL